MSELFDELARSLTTSMPRRRALRMLGGVLVGVAVPGLAATKANGATRVTCTSSEFLCKCPNRDLFYQLCCPNPTPQVRYECKCKAPPEGYAECRKVTRCNGPTCTTDGKCCPRPNRCVDGKCCPAIRTTFAPGSGQRGVACCPSGTKAVPGGIGLCCPRGQRNCCDKFDPRKGDDELAPLPPPRGKLCVNGRLRNG